MDLTPWLASYRGAHLSRWRGVNPTGGTLNHPPHPPIEPGIDLVITATKTTGSERRMSREYITAWSATAPSKTTTVMPQSQL
jgi:hypothetical protein